MPADLAQVHDRLEILDLLYRYCRGIDRLDLELLKTVYHDGAVDNHGMFNGPADEYIDWVLPMLRERNVSTTHTSTNQLIELDGDTAKVESQIQGHSVYVDPSGQRHMARIGGRFVDYMEKRNGHWGIVHRTLVSDWDATSPLTRAFDDPTAFPGGLPIDGTRDRTDYSYTAPAAMRPRTTSDH